MLQDLNTYLSLVTSDERRAILVEAFRTLEAILGDEIYIPVDELTQSEDADQSAVTTELDELVIGYMTQAFSAVGVQLDFETIEATDIHTLTDALQALYSIENHEDLSEFTWMMESAVDTVEALQAVLIHINPELEDKIDWIVSVNPSLLQRIREIARRAKPLPGRVETVPGRQERIKAFIQKHGASPTVDRLLDDGINFDHFPSYAIGILLANIDPADNDFPKAFYEVILRSKMPTEITKDMSALLTVIHDLALEPAQRNTLELALKRFME